MPQIAYKVGDIYVDGNGKEVPDYVEPAPIDTPAEKTQTDAKDTLIATLQTMLAKSSNEKTQLLAKVGSAAFLPSSDLNEEKSAEGDGTEKVGQEMKDGETGEIDTTDGHAMYQATGGDLNKAVDLIEAAKRTKRNSG